MGDNIYFKTYKKRKEVTVAKTCVYMMHLIKGQRLKHKRYLNLLKTKYMEERKDVSMRVL